MTTPSQRFSPSLYLTTLCLLTLPGTACGDLGRPPVSDTTVPGTFSGGGGDETGSGETSDSDPDGGAEDTGGEDTGSADGGPDDETGDDGDDTGTVEPVEGYFHTEGALIVDADGNTVRLTGINWFGIETETYAPHGLWQRTLDDMLGQVKDLGFNVLRLPYCTEALDPGRQVTGVDANPDLMGLSPLELMDVIIDKAGQLGLRVILDRHRPTSLEQSELWYDDAYDEARWIADWEMLTERYLGNTTVIGVDLHNEPHGPATWADGNPQTDWAAAAKRAGDAILDINPNLLIIIEGVEETHGASYWWGGNLRGAGPDPVELSVTNQTVYSTHLYPPSLYEQPWFEPEANFPSNLPQMWDQTWGYLVTEDIAPVFVGEFGSFFEDSGDLQWLDELDDYLLDNGLSFTYWCLNPNSVDTGGVLSDDWTTVNQNKVDYLTPLLAAPL